MGIKWGGGVKTSGATAVLPVRNDGTDICHNLSLLISGLFSFNRQTCTTLPYYSLRSCSLRSESHVSIHHIMLSRVSATEEVSNQHMMKDSNSENGSSKMNMRAILGIQQIRLGVHTKLIELQDGL